jgi:hypothetical protein
VASLGFNQHPSLTQPIQQQLQVLRTRQQKIEISPVRITAAGKNRASPDPVGRHATSSRNAGHGPAWWWRWAGVPGDGGGRRRGRARGRPVGGRGRRAPRLLAHRGVVLRVGLGRVRSRWGQCAEQSRTSDAGVVWWGGVGRDVTWRECDGEHGLCESANVRCNLGDGLALHRVGFTRRSRQSPLGLFGLHTGSKFRRHPAHLPDRAILS